METAVGRTFYERTKEDLSHNGPATTEGTQEKGRSNNAPLNYGHLNYSRLSWARTINAATNEFDSALRAALYCNNKSGDNGINKAGTCDMSEKSETWFFFSLLQHKLRNLNSKLWKKGTSFKSFVVRIWELIALSMELYKWYIIIDPLKSPSHTKCLI